MKTTRTTRLISAAALMTLASWSAQASAGVDMSRIETPTGETGPITREQVRHELAQWRSAGLLDQAGEAGATAQVLAARETFNDQMAVEIVARLDREQQQRLAALEAQRVAAETRAAALALAESAKRSDAASETTAQAGNADDASIVASELPLATEAPVSPVADGETLITPETEAPIDSDPTKAEVHTDPALRREE